MSAARRIAMEVTAGGGCEGPQPSKPPTIVDAAIGS